MSKDIKAALECELTDPTRVWNQIDYSRDAIIEASAGTGKTYTLQRIVLKLLKDGTIDSVRNLLLVTYTEKAAGELKDRIRAILTVAGCLPMDFDEVSICTIHSFCRKLLTEYAFENRVPMQTEIRASDAELIHQAILTALHSETYARECGDFVELMTQVDWNADKLVEEAEKRFKQKKELDEGLCDAKRAEDRKKGCQAILVNHLVRLAQKVFVEVKAESPAMTFDDLVLRAKEVIDEEAKKEREGKTSELLLSIRKKFRIALVDEFQDTDPQQWGIFNPIFSSRVNVLAEGAHPVQGALIVVGDPKQAIYSFRGADIATYLAAKQSIAGKDGQKALSLDTTFRSSPALVAAFNRIFGDQAGDDPSWFANMAEGKGVTISYSPVNPPPDEDKKFHLIKYHPAFGAPVELLESLPPVPPKVPDRGNTGFGNKAVCLPVFLRHAAQEMKRLRALSPAYTTAHPDTLETVSHRFTYGEMCILVRSNTDAGMAQRILAENGIPFSIYKEKGIYASSEAEALLVLFDFLSDPGKRGRLEAVLLTPFFGFRPDQLDARLMQGDKAFSDLTDRWQELIIRHQWNRLFESFMNDTLLAHPRKDDYGFDRRWTAIRQILDKLLEAKGRRAQSMDEFADELRAWRRDDSRAGEDGALRRKESQADRVQIMTMHVSKGLEFPVVFIAWGFGTLAYGVPKAERDASIREEKRLLYVALTRAEHKLYLPWSQWAQHKRISSKNEVDEVGIGSVGSALLIPPGTAKETDQNNSGIGFLARGIRACFGSDEAARENVLAVQQRLQTDWEGTRSGAPVSVEVPVDSCSNTLDIPVYAINEKELMCRHLQDVSYSALHHREMKNAGPEREMQGDENDFGGTLKSKALTLLPRNYITGDVFHEIMELLCKADDSGSRGTFGFQTIGRAALEELVGPFPAAEETPFLKFVGRIMHRHALENRVTSSDSTARALARMVWRALNVPIRIGDETFVLKDIPFQDRRAELCFVINRGLALGETAATDDTFNGKIDLLVRPQGSKGPVYVLDWKTNSLNDYTGESVVLAMDANDYHLQYKLYSLAIRRWLGEVPFGGAAYLFVRAGEASATAMEPAGIFVATADTITPEACIGTIKDVLRKEGV